MSKSPTPEEYNNLKQQYDQLLDKNQNDLIKVKQKQKNFNNQLSQIQKQAQQKQKTLQATIQQLQDTLAKQKQAKYSQEDVLRVAVMPGTSMRVEELEIDVRRLMDQNINLTADVNSLTAQLKSQCLENERLIIQIQRLTKYVESLENDIKFRVKKQAKANNDAPTMTVQSLIQPWQLKELQSQLSKKDSELQVLMVRNKELMQELGTYREQSKSLNESQKRYIKVLKKKQSQLSALQGEINKLKLAIKPRKRTELVEGECQKCNNFKQQIELLKQMVKSTQGMVRVKEIQNHKYKLHHSQQTAPNHSKSMLKPEDKTTPLPPLRKK